MEVIVKTDGLFAVMQSRLQTPLVDLFFVPRSFAGVRHLTQLCLELGILTRKLFVLLPEQA